MLDFARLNSDPVLKELKEMMRQIERGDPMHPQEVHDLVTALNEAGYPEYAGQLARANWDRG